MTTPVVFDYTAWAAFFTQFSTVSQANVTLCFALAELYVDNSGCGPIPNDPPANQLAQILNLATAHITALNFGVNGESPSPLVGRINSATQGSVTVTADMGNQPMSAAWWNQTPWGAMAWQALAPFRTAIYRAAPNGPFLRPGVWGRGGYGSGWGRPW